VVDTMMVERAELLGHSCCVRYETGLRALGKSSCA
jgi:hypothetical protein